MTADRYEHLFPSTDDGAELAAADSDPGASSHAPTNEEPEFPVIDSSGLIGYGFWQSYEMRIG